MNPSPPLWNWSNILCGGSILAVATLLSLLGLKLAKSRRKQSPSSGKGSAVDQILNAALNKESLVSTQRTTGRSEVEDIFSRGLINKDDFQDPKISEDVIDIEECVLLPEPDGPGESLPQIDIPQDQLKSFTSENLKGLIQDRINDLNITGLSVEQWALGVVDFIDEVSGIRNGLSDRERQHLKVLVNQLKKQLAAMDCVLIDEDEWNPKKQRAITTRKTLPKEALPRITDKGATGLMIQGKLIRKQEVFIEIAQS